MPSSSKINVKPADIKYVVLGHFHVDHAGNIGKFLDSTFVYQRDEIRNGFWPAPGYATFFITDDFAMLRNGVGGGMPSKYKTIELDGDLDLFGDNSVYIHRAVSHTPGSQIDGRPPAQDRHGGAHQRRRLSAGESRQEHPAEYRQRL